jgi:hypothetical protein
MQWMTHGCTPAQGWQGLADELSQETRRLWVRNLGRDDRIVADTGREARHPFLAEDVVDALLATPLHLVADLRLPPGAWGLGLDLRLLPAPAGDCLWFCCCACVPDAVLSRP